MKKDKGIIYYPIFLNIEGKKCVVVGGGQVALRKVGVLLEHGADVKVISPNLCPELVKLAEDGVIRALSREYKTGDIKNAFVSIAATDNNQINHRVVAEARERSVLVNVVDDAEHSDFIVPSHMRRGEVTVAISTGGKSPALARKLRSRLEKQWGDEYALLADIISEARTEIRQRKIRVSSDSWQEALDLDMLLDLLKKGEGEKAKDVLLTNLTAKQHTG
jgi:siroheme synthase-like protein